MNEANQPVAIEPSIEPMSNTPNYIAYQLLVRREGEKPFWNRVGVGFLHRDGGGLNLVLNSVPIDGKVTLRASNS